MADTPRSVTFYFDPACPWTWRTSRWLVDVADRHGVAVSYRPFELSAGGPLDEVPEQYRASSVASRSFLRAVQAASADGRDDLVGAWYTAYGSAIHDGDGTPSVELAKSTLEDVDGGEYAAALDDTAFDEAVAASREHAQSFAGDDTGSPVIVLSTAGDGERGFFGPVVAPTPTGEEADRLWGAVLTVAGLPAFFELKSRRTAEPVPGHSGS